MRFPSDVYLRCLFQGISSKQSGLGCSWEHRGGSLMCLGVLGFGEALVPALLPADGCRSLMEASGSTAPSAPCAPQKFTAELSAPLIRDSSASRSAFCQSASPNDWCNPLGRALSGSEVESCDAALSVVHQLSFRRPGCCPSSESEIRLCQVSFFSPLTKDAHYLKHPEQFCMFVFKVQVRIQTWRLVLTSLRSWANVPGPTNWNSRNILDFFSQQTKIDMFRQLNDK